MRKTFVATAVAAILSAGAFVSSGASAMTLAAPAGVKTAIDEMNNAVGPEQVRHRCFRARGGGIVCPRHRRRVVVSGGYPYGYGYGYPYYGYGYGYPAVGVGIGYGWGGWGWGGGRTVVVRRGHHHHHRGVVRHRR
jgi:hypothetical protein